MLPRPRSPRSSGKHWRRRTLSGRSHQPKGRNPDRPLTGCKVCLQAGLPSYTALARTYTECRSAAEAAGGGRKLLAQPPATEPSCRRAYLTTVHRKEAGAVSVFAWRASQQSVARYQCRCYADPAPAGQTIVVTIICNCRQDFDCTTTQNCKFWSQTGLPGYTALADTYTECLETAEGNRRLLGLQVWHWHYILLMA